MTQRKTLLERMSYEISKGLFAARLDVSSKAKPTAPEVWQRRTAEGEKYEIIEPETVRNQAELYARLSWVHTAVEMTAEVAAGTRLAVKQIEGEDFTDVINHPFELLLKRPNDLQSRFEFLVSTMSYIKLVGNAYWWVNAPGPDAPPDELWLLPSYRMRPLADGQLYLRGYGYDPGDGGTEMILETDEVVHFKKWHPTNQFVGLSAVEPLATVSVGDLSMQKYNTNYFNKDNAKIPGILAFGEMVDDVEWERLKAESKREYGGNERKLMMMRGVGQGGVEWIETAMTQEDMQFLEGRKFTKEEIWDVFAPGLNSWLSINSTEANSVSGKEAFMELAVWPVHQAVAEKISNDLLPRYGENLEAMFDDVRLEDEILQLQRRRAYERTHTIDEVRAKFDEDDPIGDERGDMLVAEIGRAASSPGEPEDGEMDMDMDADDELDEMKSLYLDDLEKWRRKALKGFEKGKPAHFESDNIPGTLAAAIFGGLKVAQDKGDIVAIFAEAEGWEGYP